MTESQSSSPETEKSQLEWGKNVNTDQHQNEPDSEVIWQGF